MKHFLTAAIAAATLGTVAHAEPVSYDIDPKHSEVLFNWNHGGFSTTRGIFFGFEGELMYDEEEPANSSVSIQIPTDSVMANAEMKEHWASDDFFGDSFGEDITFESTSIEVTGDTTAEITGDLTLNGMTNEVVLDTTLNKTGEGPQGSPISGFAATATILRSDYGLDLFVPFVSDELQVEISLEASPSDAG